MTGTKVRQDGEVVQSRCSLLIVHERLGQVALLLNEPLGIDQQLFEGRQTIT